MYIKGNNFNRELRYKTKSFLLTSDREKKKNEANCKFDDRRKLNLISGGSYKRISDDFKSTVGFLKVKNFVASAALKQTLYSGIRRNDQPCIIMQVKHHRKLSSTITRLYRNIKANFMTQGNFYMALRVEIIAFFKSGILNVYADDIVQMMEYISYTDIPNTLGRLIKLDEFEKLVKMIEKKREREPESTSSDYADLYEE